ncbi:hypothetical protein PYW07_004218 [Mythimna separata]|uniref:VWFC domain-containing protein n=1 Tax=Mythimna separata TaxID=271217 RepID=A0AAD7YPN7_MYTSE|nr:hypothetical protein PYW07_004218 [Mythimna separata]
MRAAAALGAGAGSAPVQRRPSPPPPASMSPLLALAAAAALLVCARAGALDVVELVFPDSGRDRTYRNNRDPPIQFPSDLHTYSLKTSETFDSKVHHNKAHYTDNERHQIIPNYLQHEVYDPQKTARRIILIDDHHDKAHALQKSRPRLVSNDEDEDDTELDRGLKHFIPNNHQDKIYYDFLQKKSKTSNEPRVRGYDSDNVNERHQVNLNDRRGREYEVQKHIRTYVRNERQDKAYPSGQKTELPSACLYDGRWHSNGAAVPTAEDCLSCVCAAGALSCRRRACAPLPDPLPPRCHVRHRRSTCCPELHCPDGVQLMEHGASARSDSGDMSAETDALSVAPLTAKNACVEGGSVFAAGSALAARLACEQCFCLGGARHCVRPACLAPPPHCAPRPAPGACCPQRYYCHPPASQAEQHRSKYDCLVSGTWVSEGSPVESRGNCSACFCLRGEVRCQALGCAPALAGCRPLLAPGACCAHQYVCDHDDHHSMQTGTQSHMIAGPTSSSAATRHDERTLHSSKSGKLESTTKKILTSLYTLKHTSFASATKNHLITTTKVKRKTNEPPVNSSTKPELNTNTTSTNTTTTQKPMSAAKLIAMPEYPPSFESEDSPDKAAEQPEGTVKIMINGTINCTAELSSTSLPLSIMNDTDKQLEVMPRIPIVNVEAQTYSPNDIITDRNVNGGFDEDDTFTINVTSSLMTNTSHSTSRPVATGPKVPIPVDLAEALNSSKKKKGEYDYDYTKPTLPPSLPNLKIIPFVAADAVVDDEPTKETLNYPILEREDKFPVYYPSSDAKDNKFPVRREDTYQPTQYPVFVLGNVEPSYPPISHEVDVPRDRYPEDNDPGVHEYTVSASLGSQGSDMKTVTQVPPTSTTYAVETPAVNLFSPPVETEGGFLPKGSGAIDEYFGVYPSTPPGPPVPHLTTSMQLDVIKDVDGECVVEGQRVADGQSIVLGCQLCTCSWARLACSRRPCAPPRANCRRLPATNQSADPCCGDLDCSPEINATTAKPPASAATTAAEENTTVKKENEEDITKDAVSSTTSNPFIPITNKTETADSKASSTEQATANEQTTPSQVNAESVPQTTTTPAPTTTSVKPTPKATTTTTTPTPVNQVEDASAEDEEDEDDDGGFSFGSVLKLLLSDSYETTTAPSKKLPTRPPPTAPPGRFTSTSAPPTGAAPTRGPTKTSYSGPLARYPSSSAPPTRAPIRTHYTVPPARFPSSSASPISRPEEETVFKPLPPRQPYINPLNTVNRIDHLVLGEATAIKRTTHRPITNKTTKRPAPLVHERPTSQTYERPTPQVDDTTERRPEVQEDSAPFTPVTGGPRPPSLGSLPGVGPGLLKLAGCNIYGRMYRVGRIITELSTPCTECWCTELGVQCKPLNC